MERVGIERRLPAALLDAIFLGIIVGIVITAVAAIGGTRLAFDVSEELGVPLSVDSFNSDEIWEEFGLEVEAMANDLEAQFRDDFTPEQAEFMSDVMEQTFADSFNPDQFTLQFLLNLDAQLLDDLVDRGFDAVIAAEREDIPADRVNALRDEVKLLMDRFAIGQIVPRVIRFAVWIALIPLLVALGYRFVEAISGRTLGKLALGIVIERADEDDGPPVPSRMLRYAVKNSPLLLGMLAVLTRSPALFALAGLAAVVVVIGSLVMLGAEKRALHDYVAGTAVFRA